MSKQKTIAERKRRQPRPRVVPWWRRRLVIAAAGTMLAGTVAAGGWWAWRQHWPHRLADAATAMVVAASTELGFTVDEIFVVGRRETTPQALRDALGIGRGAAILAFDIHAARRRVLALPWVESVAIERLLPDTLVVHIGERRPLALWQHRGSFALIDDNGEVIARSGVERFGNLPVVVGEDAPRHAAGILGVLATQPELAALVEAVVRVGGRRWNVRLAGGIDVRLPEDDPSGAWEKLAEYQRVHGLLRKDVKVLDLRLPDRLIVRGVPRPDTGEAAAGRET